MGFPGACRQRLRGRRRLSPTPPSDGQRRRLGRAGRAHGLRSQLRLHVSRSGAGRERRPHHRGRDRHVAAAAALDPVSPRPARSARPRAVVEPPAGDRRQHGAPRARPSGRDRVDRAPEEQRPATAAAQPREPPGGRTHRRQRGRTAGKLLRRGAATRHPVRGNRGARRRRHAHRVPGWLPAGPARGSGRQLHFFHRGGIGDRHRGAGPRSNPGGRGG